MTDLISRQDALDAIKVSMNIWSSMPEWREHKIIECLEELPSAQPEIIRCKDCKHIQRCRSEESAKKFGQIYECARNVFDSPKPEDYCSWSERREE